MLHYFRLDRPPPLLGLLCLLPTFARAQITVYKQIPLGQTATAIAAGAAQTTLPAYDATVLIPPAIPIPPPATAYTLPVQRDAAAVQGLSIPHVGGGFFGFSVEMSVINQVLGKNSSLLQVPFLNLMANIQERAGSVLVRLGGNTQEYAVMVDTLPDGHTIAKQRATIQQTTETPAVEYTVDLFYMASNISSFVNVNWFIGIPFNDSTNWRLAIAENAQTIIGDNLLGMQAGNEPDYYASHGIRAVTYGPYDYFGEFSNLITTISQNSLIPRKNILIGPSLASGDWMPEQVWDTGFIPAFKDSLYALTILLANPTVIYSLRYICSYPNNNCFAVFGVGAPQDPQENFKDYLTHAAGVNMVRMYLNSTAIAQAAGKPFIMFETNSATCGGFPGLSDSFGAALWALDYGLQMAYSNFSNALLHVGGQNVYYNPFTAPLTNQSTFNQWTIGAVYYSALVMAEAFSTTNTSRTMDLWGNAANLYTPSYAIYENDVLSKVALFNYVDDRTGASDINVAITIPGSTVPASVKVKYLESESVSFKNITWAGQTFGGPYEVDGRLRGDLSIVTVACDQAANTCNVPVAAPGFALVFMQDITGISSVGQASLTFSTTVRTSGGTATVDPVVLATSNGHSGKDRALVGSTSKGSIPDSACRVAASRNGRGLILVAVLWAAAAGAIM
ncbi:glycoside hydrolase family 79 protein [Hypholoma sublateritium FD-334 SS-4]|uniref:Glycoside hydrolase family 79 protein n=1 Tax=Hypholoma sublateritium (strain FD-334 SS-4) TaxID=945553 RepID=A0A0D2PZX5_HYPSF|nr:glycoside hydrolase family 79 protein [Hypholoma sublateritium FD-334 SS-4]